MTYILLFFNIFIFYLYTIFPTTAPYRDAGEMVTVSRILSIAHPPGYPLYILLSNIFIRLLPIGNYAYRLNIFSALFSSLSTVLMYHLLRKIFLDKEEKSFLKEIVIYFLALIFSFNYLQWYLSLVAEMYTLNIFFVVLIIYLFYVYFREQNFYNFIIFFVFGIALTNRLDIILMFPFIFFYLVSLVRYEKLDFKKSALVFFIFIIGMSVYLYMPIRSSVIPRINWNNPAKLENFISSITRKTHGSTLDLLSVNYSSGENFFSGINFYLKHLSNKYTFLGFIIIIYGIFFLFKENKIFFLSNIISWLISCVWFIYRSNLPPNPHAMAILEAHFLLPNVFVFIFFVYGVKFLLEKKLNYVIILMLGITLFYNIGKNFNKINKRENYFAYDYTKNLLRCLPKGSILVVREDVQLFSLWYETIVNKNREDIVVIAEGLSGSEWYKDVYKTRDRNIYISRINRDTVENFVNNNFKLGNREIFFTYDVELGNFEKYFLIPYGFCLKVLPKDFMSQENKNQSKFLLDEIMFYRGDYVYDLDKEFFSSDLVEDYSKARYNYGYYLMMREDYESSIEEFKKSIFLNKDYPMNYFFIGYIYFKNSNYQLSKNFYEMAVEKYNLYYNLSIKYNALPDVKENFKTQLANAYLHLGVVNEKLGDLETSEKNYNESIKIKNDFSQAYYNLGVIYWHKGDWEKVKYYFEKTIYYDPQNMEAKYFLEKIKRDAKK